MAENGVFHSDSNFFKKWQKPRVEALKRSEIECLGFTERERETFAKLIFHLSFLLNFVKETVHIQFMHTVLNKTLIKSPFSFLLFYHRQHLFYPTF